MPEWRRFRKDNNIKSIPYKLERTYSDEWQGTPHFFGTEIFSYEEAKKFIKKFKIQSSRDYVKFTQTTDSVINLPGVPYRVYKNEGWINWKEYLGYQKRKSSRKEYASLHDAKKILYPLNLQSSKEYMNLLRDDVDFKKTYQLTTKPTRVYKDSGWKGFQDYLGYIRISKFVSYEDCKTYAIELGVKKSREWYENKKSRPKNIPSDPPNAYKNKGWKGWSDFLGKDDNQ
ncbi:MAG: hypothetical protein HN563_02900 [Flavobacteriales bacterium]|nr:hypothetical protein [Flavobacteriales bacterium]